MRPRPSAFLAAEFIGATTEREKLFPPASLESYGVAALLELDRGVGFHARLRGHYPWRIFFAIDSDRSSTALNPLESAPEIEPTSLYWQGRSAGNLPAQFLGFYQVLEYYFPRCSRIAFVQELRAKLDKSSQECVDKVVFEHLEAAARSKGRPFGSEEDQLVCTLRAIVSEVELREFVNACRCRQRRLTCIVMWP